MALPEVLLARLDAIGTSLAATDKALALLGLGSVGIERDRIDAYSDLDFFVIAKPGWKHDLMQNLSWLSTIAPIAYHFQNTNDGYKLLYADGIFCEFGIFEQTELATIGFSQGRIVWKADGVADSIATPLQLPRPTLPQVEWSLGEALTNLYVGLGRDQRGEKLAAMRLIQNFAVDRVLELLEHIQLAQSTQRDVFGRERRIEQRFPDQVEMLASCMQGYTRNRESAAAMLDFLEQHFVVHPAMAQAIRALY